MRLRIAACFSFFISSSCFGVNPYVAGVLAEIFPGAGYAYIGNRGTAGLASTLIIPMAAQIARDHLDPQTDAVQPLRL